jgi:hypothetical protein
VTSFTPTILRPIERIDVHTEVGSTGGALSFTFEPSFRADEGYHETYGTGRSLRLEDDWTELFRLEIVKTRSVVRGVRIEIR